MKRAGWLAVVVVGVVACAKGETAPTVGPAGQTKGDAQGAAARTAPATGAPAALPTTALDPRDPPPRPGRAFTREERACKGDDDCAADYFCLCPPPCDTEWASAANKRTIERVTRERGACPPASCPPACDPFRNGPWRSATGFVGNRLACIKGLCTTCDGERCAPEP
jgi:hypothetical protein